MSSETAYNKRDEAIAIALESTGELIPLDKMVEKIQRDLEKIRSVDSELRKVIHDPKWKPGVLKTQNLSVMDQKEIETSEFKPVSIMQVGDRISVMEFEKPYHPEKLATLLNMRFGLMSEPQYLEQANKVVYRDELSTYYFNPSNGRNCEDTCLAQFSVSVDQFDEQEGNNNQL